MQRPNPLTAFRLLRRAGAAHHRILLLTLESLVRREARGVHRLLELHAATRPDAAAVVQGARRVSFSELASRVRRTAGALGTRGLGPRERFAVALPNSPELLTVTGALRTVGAIRVPASPHWREAELRHCLENSGARGLAYPASARETVRAATAGIATLDPSLVVEVAAPDDEALRAGSAPGGRPAGVPLDVLLAGPLLPLPPDEVDRGPDTPAIVYTSGTTGTPKGARPLVADLFGLTEVLIGLFGLRAAETILIPAPLHHAAPALLADLGLLLGATIVLPPRFDAEETLALIERERVTFAYLVPYMLQRLLELPEELRRRHSRSSLRGVMSAAALLRPETRIAALDLFGEILMEFYGSTEAGVVSFLAPKDQRRKAETVGRPIPGVRLRIVGEDGRERRPGETGEILVKSKWLRTEYVGLSAETDEAHLDGYFRTGDLGAVDDEGFLSIKGRLKDMINSAGVKVFPAEVERVIAQHPQVRDVAVFAVSDARWGEAVCAAVVRAEGAAIDEAALQGWLKERIAGYKVPKRVVFEADLPRNPQGKVMKRLLKEAYERDQR